MMGFNDNKNENLDETKIILFEKNLTNEGWVVVRNRVIIIMLTNQSKYFVKGIDLFTDGLLFCNEFDTFIEASAEYNNKFLKYNKGE